jgi:muramidase (phage lysozyme)
MRGAGLVILAGLSLLLLSRQAQARQGAPVDADLMAELYPPDPAPVGADWIGLDAVGDEPLSWDDEGGAPFDSYTSPEGFMPIGAADPQQLSALLYTIRTAEVGPVPDADRYFMGYGFKRFEGTADHPVVTGELQRVPLSDTMCRNAGLRPPCFSSAAGAYQFRTATWAEMRKAGPWGPRLPDFSPASQDEAARRLLASTGALARLSAGDIEGAIRLAGRHWASLPGSTAQQNPKSMAQAMAFYAAGLRRGGPTMTV